MELVALERLSPYVSMHMYIIQIGQRTHPVRQFEGKVTLDSELDLKLDSWTPNWLGPLLEIKKAETLMCEESQ
jgi:hypothetical protein